MKDASKKRKSKKILIIDDEAVIREGCRQVLTRKGYHVDCTGDADEGLQMGMRNSYDLILLDVRMPNMSGMDILKKLKEENNVNTRIIMITGYGTIPLAVEAMRQGACNFLTKPYSATELHEAVCLALKDDEEDADEQNHSLMIGCSDYMKELKDSIGRIALTDSAVLITGSSGTGKELVARSIHQLSQRPTGLLFPLIVHPCLKILWKANFSDMSRAPSAGPRKHAMAGSRWLIQELYSLMKFPISI